jgi:hypothetical protein
VSPPAPADFLSISADLEHDLIRPPVAGSGGACSICCDWLDASGSTCSKCQHASSVLGRPLVPVVPVTLYVKPSRMRDRLKFYKEPRGPEDGGLAVEVASILARFFHEHGAELTRRYGMVDAATVVPTRKGDAERHPLDAALDRHIGDAVLPRREPLLSVGQGNIERRSPHPRGFVASSAAAGRSLVLIDDVYTTGAVAQSAAHALREVGAVVPVIVVVGRRLNPDYHQAVADLVKRQQDRGFSFTESPWDP